MQTVSKEQAVAPFKLAIIDLLDANHYADFFEDKWRYAWLTGGFAPNIEYDIITNLADRIFWALNPEATTQEEWYKDDAGYDVRVYDKNNHCVYKAHEILPKSGAIANEEYAKQFPKNAERLKRLTLLREKASKKLEEIKNKNKDVI